MKIKTKKLIPFIASAFIIAVLAIIPFFKSVSRLENIRKEEEKQNLAAQEEKLSQENRMAEFDACEQAEDEQDYMFVGCNGFF